MASSASSSSRSLLRPRGARVGFEVFGWGPTTVLALAPGGMRSSRANWPAQPIDPTSDLWLPHEQYTVIAMDQRTADERCTVPDGHGWGWDTFRDDQLALLDHCEVERAHLLGSCIGPSFAMKLLVDQPSRFGAAVMMVGWGLISTAPPPEPANASPTTPATPSPQQPIGLAPRTTEAVRAGNACSKYGVKWDEGEGGLNSQATEHWFGDWASAVQREGRGSTMALGAFQRSLFDDAEGSDFVFSATEAQVAEVAHPLLVLMGNDGEPSTRMRDVPASSTVPTGTHQPPPPLRPQCSTLRRRRGRYRAPHPIRSSSRRGETWTRRHSELRHGE